MNDNRTDSTGDALPRFEVGFFRPADAQGIVRLFKEVYGDGYPIKLFYDPQALEKANAEGEYYSIVARTASGKVVGAQHLFRSAPYRGLYELGAGLVLKEYRRLGVNNRMMGFVFQDWLQSMRNIEETFGEPVCNHLHMQKVVAELKHVETALEVALMPAEAYDREKSAEGRVATLLAFRCYQSLPHAVFMPSAYEKELRFLYSGLDDARTLLISDTDLPGGQTSKGEITFFDFARVARVAMLNVGYDFETYLEKLEEEGARRNLAVIQIWIKLGSRCSGAAAEVLREKGYFLGGLLPRWFNHDGLLMQKLFTEPDFDGIQLYSDRAKTMFDMVREDFARTRS